MLKNKIKDALKNGEATLGIGLTGPINMPMLQVLASCTVEWLFLDMEHGSLDISDLLEVVQIAGLLGMSSVLRIPDLAYHWVARSLDTGALSIMVPRVENRKEAELAVRWVKFPPAGIRGMGIPGHLRHGASISVRDWVESSNRETMVLLQIESVTAVENIEAIASVPGVDALFIGPLDMSISIGKPGDTGSEESHKQFRRVCRVAREHRLSTGIVCRADQIKFYYDMGVRMFSVGTARGHLRTAIHSMASEFLRQIS